ncbi:MAG: hypothetical protein L3J62_11700 [Gammaproteobacteria bacterium]|nr:hypothetical protein [Gammaproteobacteria bacterium]
MSKQEVTHSRHIKLPVQLMLWGKSAGRCQFEGCNKRLWENGVTKEIDEEHINDLRNLMLACHECHTLIDEDKDGEKIFCLASLKDEKRSRGESRSGGINYTQQKKPYSSIWGQYWRTHLTH